MQVPSAAGQLTRAGLPSILATRIAELVASGTEDTALLSALRLADSFLTLASSPPDLLLLGRASLQVVAHVDQPEVLVAALELLTAILSDSVDDGQEDDVKAAACMEEKKRLRNEMQQFAISSSGAERLALLLAESSRVESSTAAIGVALAILQYASTDDLADHREDLAAAYLAAVQNSEAGLIEGSDIFGKLSQRFVDWMQTPPAEEMQ